MQTSRLFVAILALSFVVCGALLTSCEDAHAPRSGAELFADVGCVNCHGQDGKGTVGFAPTLHGKKSHWTRETMIAYLKDPTGYARKDPRLKAQARGFSLPMPPVVFTLPVEYEHLADYVLAMP